MVSTLIYLHPLIKAATARTILGTLKSMAPEAGEKFSPVAVAGGAVGAASLLPWSTMRAGYDKLNGTEKQNQGYRGVSTDLGRDIGGGLGAGATMGLAEHFHVPRGNNLLNAAMLLGGGGLGEMLGHMRGKSVGQDLFPGSFSDRLHHAVQNF